jgi:hypothetical protein
MGKLLESTAAQMTAAFQRIGANVDLEVLSWPGGYLIAASVWLYMRAADLARRVIERRSRLPSRTREDCRIVQLPKDSR